MAAIEKKESIDAEFWKTVPFDEQVEIDMAIDRGKREEAVKRCRSSGKGFTLITAKKIVERRIAELAKRRIPRKK